MCGFIMGTSVLFLLDLRELETSSPSAPAPSPTVCDLPEFLGTWQSPFWKLTTGRIQFALLSPPLVFLLSSFASDKKNEGNYSNTGNPQTSAQDVAVAKVNRKWSLKWIPTITLEDSISSILFLELPFF